MEIKTQGFTTKPADGQQRKTWGEKALVTRLGKINIGNDVGVDGAGLDHFRPADQQGRAQ